MSVPNQRIVVINRASTGGRNFTQIDKDLSAEAFINLSYHEFKLWYYLCGNMNGYKTELSFVAVQNQTGIKRSSYYEAFNGLQTKGYLQLIKGNYFNFFEKPIENIETPQKNDTPPIKFDF